jgi:tRNA (guanine-N7-)-methyltransferase
MTLQPTPVAVESGDADGEGEGEEEWMGAMGGLELADSAVADASEQAKPTVDKKRLRQLRSKPGWYRRVSQHVSKGAKKRIRALWPKFGIEAPPWSVALNIPALFAPRLAVQHVVVEVGFGGGDCLVPLATELAATRPDVAFIGCEWHVASMGGALARLDGAELSNAKVFRGDVLHHLRAGWFGPAAVDEVLVVCPDPWPKEADWPRRVVNPESAALLAQCTKPGGYLHVATDVLDYARWVGRVMAEAGEAWEACARPEGSALFQSAAKPLRCRDEEEEEAQEEEEQEQGDVDVDAPLPPCFCHAPELVAEVYGLLPERPRWRPVTRYEWRGVTELGHSIYDLCYRRKG